MTAPRYDIPFVRDDGGEERSGIASELPSDRLEAVRSVAIVTGKSFAEVHAHAGEIASVSDNAEAWAAALAGRAGLTEVDLFGHFDYVPDPVEVLELGEDTGVRRFMLMVDTAFGETCHCAVREGKIHGVRDVLGDVGGGHEIEVVGLWVRDKEAGKMEGAGPDRDTWPA